MMDSSPAVHYLAQRREELYYVLGWRVSVLIEIVKEW